MTSRPGAHKTSVFSKFRLAGAGTMIGVGLVGAIFYGLLNSQYMGRELGRTLGPYTDTLSQAGFDSSDPEIWQKIAQRHGVRILLEPADAAAAAWDEEGKPTSPAALIEQEAPIRAVRTSSIGTRVTFYWDLRPFPGTHLRMLGGLLLMMLAVVGAAFWFLQQQLKPLAGLQTGVEAVARGDFGTHVPVVRDDEIGRVAATFNEMTSRVGEMIGTRERLLGDVSHELRSPIARMKVALELMPAGGKRDGLAADLKEMEELITILLEREELRSRAGPLEGQEVDLQAIAAEVAAAFADRGPGVELISERPLIVRADASLMKLLLQNLVDNAVKFSHPDSAPVTISVERDDDKAVVEVVDDGIGLPPGSEKRAFEAFTKLNPARGHRIGHGLGLNLCQRIVQLHEGRIELRPRKPRGSQALVVLGGSR